MKKKPKQKELDDLKETLQRLQAEFENYKKQCDREAERSRAFSTRSLIEQLLPVLDSFDQALKSTKDESCLKGFTLIQSQLMDALKSQGLRRFESVGKALDPYRHEVMLQVPGKEGIVIEEVQPGYMLNEMVLRHAKVTVGKVEEKHPKGKTA